MQHDARSAVESLTLKSLSMGQPASNQHIPRSHILVTMCFVPCACRQGSDVTWLSCKFLLCRACRVKAHVCERKKLQASKQTAINMPLFCGFAMEGHISGQQPASTTHLAMQRHSCIATLLLLGLMLSSLLSARAATCTGVHDMRPLSTAKAGAARGQQALRHHHVSC